MANCGTLLEVKDASGKFSPGLESFRLRALR